MSSLINCYAISTVASVARLEKEKKTGPISSTPATRGLTRSCNRGGWKNREVAGHARHGARRNINLWKIKFDDGAPRRCDGKQSDPAMVSMRPQGVLLFEELCFLTEIPAGSCNNSNEAMPILSLKLYLYKPGLWSSRTESARGITGYRERILHSSQAYIALDFFFFG